eukprot:868980-Lingulodinium_polyedra.AAC.1
MAYVVGETVFKRPPSFQQSYRAQPFAPVLTSAPAGVRAFARSRVPTSTLAFAAVRVRASVFASAEEFLS